MRDIMDYLLILPLEDAVCLAYALAIQAEIEQSMMIQNMKTFRQIFKNFEPGVIENNLKFTLNYDWREK